jgi:hypothetical protein
MNRMRVQGTKYLFWQFLCRNQIFSFFLFQAGRQGDQIGRIFPHWVSVYFGQFSVNFRSSPNLWATVFHWKVYVLILTKKCVGQHFGQFFHKLIWSPCLQAYGRNQCNAGLLNVDGFISNLQHMDMDNREKIMVIDFFAK